MKNSITTKALYERLLAMPDLHSTPELEGKFLIWRLYKNAYIQAYCEDHETCIDILSDSVYLSSVAHWHPDEEDMLEELYTLGKKDNILVIKKSLLATSVFYMGDPTQYPLPRTRKWDWGKKKHSFGTLLYLEQKENSER